MSESTGPPEEAYGRVTNPERYRILHSAGLALLDRLSDQFLVERREGHDVDTGLPHDAETERVIRLVPSAEGAGSLTIVFSTFPGLLVRFGEWHVEAYPSCGCDACDEDPSYLVDTLTGHVIDLVSGQFSESIGKGRKTWKSYQFSTASGSSLLNAEDPPLPRGADRHWKPWSLRHPETPAKA